MIEETVLDILSRSTFKGNNLYLPKDQLPRELYVKFFEL